MKLRVFVSAMLLTIFFTAGMGATLMLTACAGSPANAETVRSTTTPTAAYWTGNGASDISVAVLVPDGRGIAANEAYLPTMVQGVLVGDFTKFSAMTVLDRQNLEKVIAEGESGYYSEENNFVQLGAVANVQYILNGALQKTGAGFSLQLKVTEAASGVSKAAYTGAVSAAELENLSGINKASADLLSQLGVNLTAEGKAGLQGAASVSTIQAETALSKGIVAQRSGTVVEAMSYYYEAAKFDPSLAEAASRNAVITASVTSGGLGRSDSGQGGNIGQDVRNEIARFKAVQEAAKAQLEANKEWRGTWVKTLNDAAAFFKDHPPFELIYDPALTTGNIDYAKETVDISFNALIAGGAGAKIIRDLDQGLANTGRNVSWKDVAGNTTAGWGLSIQPIYNAIPARYTVSASLTNENGEMIGTTGWYWEPIRNYEFSYLAGVITFSGVNANKITDKLTVAITDINGMSPQTAGERGYISVVTAKYDVPNFTRNYDLSLAFGNYDLSLAFGEAAIVKYYKANSEQAVIPGTILGRPVTIGAHAFSHDRLTSVTISNSVTSIGAHAFLANNLTSITIPNSVTSIGAGAFARNKLTSVTIGNSVTSIGAEAFAGDDFGKNRITSVTIGNSVTSIGEGAFADNLLASVSIPDSVTSIGARAFANNDKRFYREDDRIGEMRNVLNSVTLPANVRLGKDALPSGCMSAYENNSKRAGTYKAVTDKKGNITWSYKK